ncbi:hypothetical protein D3C76_1139190 [compost metagenome]
MYACECLLQPQLERVRCPKHNFHIFSPLLDFTFVDPLTSLGLTSRMIHGLFGLDQKTFLHITKNNTRDLIVNPHNSIEKTNINIGVIITFMFTECKMYMNI